MLIERIEIFSQWMGFADPPSHAAKLVITRQDEHFLRERLPERKTDELSADLLSRLLETLARPAVTQLDPAMFEIPEAPLRMHYGAIWTDDCPAHLVEITLSSGELIRICSEAQHAFMLPLKVSRLAANGLSNEVETFDPRLSRAVAALMPEGYLEKDRLAGKSGILEHDLREPDRGAGAPAELPDSGLPVENFADVAARHEDVVKEIYRILSRVESPEEIAAAERAGKFSERLLKRISAADARSLLARGADPNFADDVGQTALMRAAFPPFDRERFRLLMEAGANVEARRNDGFTGLHLACAGGEAEAAAEWVQAGADVFARTPTGATPLMLAATWPRIVRSLLAAGADVNAADEDGHTPLVYATVRQTYLDAGRGLEALRALVDAGADVNQADREGTTPLVHARQALARVELEAEVSRAFHPDADLPRRQTPSAAQLAATVVDMIASAGARP